MNLSLIEDEQGALHEILTTLSPTLSPMTQDECALLLGISRERVSFVERQAIKKLRRMIARDRRLVDLFADFAD